MQFSILLKDYTHRETHDPAPSGIPSQGTYAAAQAQVRCDVPSAAGVLCDAGVRNCRPFALMIVHGQPFSCAVLKREALLMLTETKSNPALLVLVHLLLIICLLVSEYALALPMHPPWQPSAFIFRGSLYFVYDFLPTNSL